MGEMTTAVVPLPKRCVPRRPFVFSICSECQRLTSALTNQGMTRSVQAASPAIFAASSFVALSAQFPAAAGTKAMILVPAPSSDSM